MFGQVNRPGRFPLETTNTRVSEMIAIAGGIAGPLHEPAAVSSDPPGRIIFLVLLTTVAVTVVVSLLLPKQYTGTATVVIDVKSPDPRNHAASFDHARVSELGAMWIVWLTYFAAP